MKLFSHILNIFSLLVISFGLGIWNLGLGIFATCAQPYAPINPDRIAYFAYSDYYNNTFYNAIRIDSIKIDSSFTIYKNYLTFGEDPYDINWDCVDIYDTSWIGYQIIKKQNGDYIFFNRWLDSMVIKTQALLNESWIMCRFPDSAYFLATVNDISFGMVLGQPDSIKTISLQKKSKTGVNVSDPFNGKQIKIGKNSGFIQTYFLHKFPLDTSVRTLAGLTNPDIGEQNPTVKSIFDYNIGDIFHFSEGYRNLWGGGIVELVKRIVLEKNYSPDNNTIYYSYLDSIAYVQYKDSTIDSAHLYVDTTGDVIPIQFPLFDSLLPFQCYIDDSSGNIFNYRYSIVQSTLFNGRLKKTFYWDALNTEDSCYHQIPVDDCEYTGHYYIAGCGQRFFPSDIYDLFEIGYWWGGFGGYICWNELKYFKKSTEEWGTPIVFPGIAEQNVEKPKVKISPNPFSEKAVLEIQGMRLEHAGFELMIYDLLGNALVNYHSTGLRFEIGRNGLSSGIYFFKLFEEKNLLHVAKIIIE